MARRAVLARVVAGGTHLRETMAIEEIAPLHAEQTSQRDVPTQSKTLNTYAGLVSKAGSEIPSMLFFVFFCVCRKSDTLPGALIALRNLARVRNGGVRLVNPPPTVQRLFEVVRAGEIFDIVKTRPTDHPWQPVKK